MAASVDIIGYKFMPDMIEVSIGATVTWMNKDGPTHAVVSDTEAFSSSTIVTGQSYSYTFETAGNYSYHCGIHPNMYGVIIVK
jgi:plastocyanin